MPGFGRAFLFSVGSGSRGLFCGGRDFLEDSGGCCRRVGRLGDRSADDEEVGSGGDGGSGCCDTLLVADGGSGGADAGNDEGGFGEGVAGGGYFLCAADEAADAGVPGHGSKAGDLGGGRVGDADGVELGCVHTGEDGYGEKLRRV